MAVGGVATRSLDDLDLGVLRDDDRAAASSAADLTRAFAADLAPLQSVIAESTSPEDCIRRVEAWISQHNPANAADVIEKALYVYSMAGARSAQRPTTRRPKS